MTIVERTVNVIEHFENLFKNKFFKCLFMTVFVAFFVFTTFNVYAQEETTDLTDVKIDLEGSWEEEQEFTNEMQGVESGSEDITTLQANSTLATLQMVGTKMCVKCFKNGDKVASNENLSGEVKAGLLDILDDNIIAMTTNPMSVDVVSHLAQEWVPGYDSSSTDIYAIGGHESGYEELKMAGVDVLWSRVRNIAYVMFVIVMIVIGFMIMFRSKIGGQTMVTIGNAIPNVIIALVLVTFSFAIAGLIIDLGGLLLIFIYSILSGKSAIDYTEFVGIDGPFEIFTLIFTGKGTIVNGWMGGGALATGATAGILSLIPALGITIGGAAVTGGVALIIGGIVVVLVFLVIAGIVAYGCFKVWIMLWKSYISIILQVIGAPIILMTAALPGNTKAIGNWIKGIARNVLVFPATFGLLNLPDALMGSGNVSLRLPGSLVFEDPSTYTSDGTNISSAFVIVIVEIILIFVASQIPAFLEAILPSNSSPALQKAGEKSREALSKMPLLGSVFGK
jgi:hypothetical protein